MVSRFGGGLTQPAGGEFQGATGPPGHGADAARAQSVYDLQHHGLFVQESHVDGVAHAESMDVAAGPEKHPVPPLPAVTAEQAARTGARGVRHLHSLSRHAIFAPVAYPYEHAERINRGHGVFKRYDIL